jgi:hypothetical protein
MSLAFNAFSDQYLPLNGPGLVFTMLILVLVFAVRALDSKHRKVPGVYSCLP